MQSVENSEAFDRLLNEIDSYIQGNAYRNYSSFGKKAQIEKSRMSRILNRKYVPSIREIRNILEVVGKSSDSLDYIRELHPHTFEDFMRSINEVSPASCAPKKLETMMENDISARIFLMANTRVGVTREEVRNEFGSHGVGILENFIAEGFLSDTDDTVKGSKDKFYLTPRMTKVLIGQLSRLWDSTKMGSGENFIGLLTESVSEEARSEIFEVLKESYRQVREIIRDPDNNGDCKVWISSMMDDFKIPKDIM